MALGGSNSDSVAHDQIRAFVERVERLDEELKAINDDKKEIFAEAKGNGFDVKALKIVIQKRRQDVSERMELEAVVSLYEAALGMTTMGDDEDDEPAPRARAREERITSTTQNTSNSGPDSAENSDLDTALEPAHSAPSGVAADQEEDVPPTSSSEPIQSGEAHQEGAADGESPSPDPAEESGPNAGGENVARANHANEAGQAANETGPALHPAALNALKLRPHCLHADDLNKCAGFGKRHCGMCLAAHADADGMSA